MPFRISTFPALLALLCSAPLASAQEPPAQITSQNLRSFYDSQSRDWAAIPQRALLAFAAAEDRYFFDKNPQTSTITIQIAGWLHVGGSGRLLAIATAKMVGDTLSHDEILMWYVNSVFLGQSCFGISAAAGAYFGKAVDQLHPEEIAFLAALPRAPALFHPVRAHERARERRNFVLSEMQKAGLLSRAEAKAAIQSALAVRKPLARCTPRN